MLLMELEDVVQGYGPEIIVVGIGVSLYVECIFSVELNVLLENDIALSQPVFSNRSRSAISINNACRYYIVGSIINEGAFSAWRY